MFWHHSSLSLFLSPDERNTCEEYPKIISSFMPEHKTTLSSEEIETTLKDYKSANIISAPDKLDNIFVHPKQTEITLMNLAVTYSSILVAHCENDERLSHNLQLFEIPSTTQNCKSYCGNGYNNRNCFNSWWTPDESWLELDNSEDFSCREGFEKVFIYGSDGRHMARQWGDGTILHKMGETRFGATPVYRVTDPNHPLITYTYASVYKIYIRRCPHGAVPAPSFNDQSTWRRARVDFLGREKSSLNLDALKGEGDQQWKTYYEEICKQQKVLQSLLITTGSNNPQVEIGMFSEPVKPSIPSIKKENIISGADVGVPDQMGIH